MMSKNVTQYREINMKEAPKYILGPQNRNGEVKKNVRNLEPLMSDQKFLWRKTESIFITMESRYHRTGLQDEATLAVLKWQIHDLEQGTMSTSFINKCDQLCGGSSSCMERATTKSSNALDLTQQALALLNRTLDQSRAPMNKAKLLSDEVWATARQVLVFASWEKVYLIGQATSWIVSQTELNRWTWSMASSQLKWTLWAWDFSFHLYSWD